MCNEVLGLETDQLNIEFTRHCRDEIYHQRMGNLVQSGHQMKALCNEGTEFTAFKLILKSEASSLGEPYMAISSALSWA
jgi:hypothetical protein